MIPIKTAVLRLDCDAFYFYFDGELKPICLENEVESIMIKRGKQ
jgi:hypothetical protein